MSQPCYCLKHSRIFFYFLKRFYVCRFFIRATFSCHRLIVKLIGSNKSDHVTSIIEYHSVDESKIGWYLYLPFPRAACLCSWAFCHSIAVSLWSGNCIPETTNFESGNSIFEYLLSKIFCTFSSKTFSTNENKEASRWWWLFGWWEKRVLSLPF